MVPRDRRVYLADPFGGQSRPDDLEFTYPTDPKVSDGQSR